MIDPHARANASLTILKWQLVVVERNKIEREKDERRKKVLSTNNNSNRKNS